MYYIVILVIAISFVWGCIATSAIEIQGFIPAVSWKIAWVAAAGTFWGVAAVYLIDLVSSHRRKNTDFLRVFYAQLHDDLIAMLSMAVILFFVFRYASTQYEFSNIDIACLGLPLFVYAILSIVRAKDKTGVLVFKAKIKSSIVAIYLVMLAVSSWVLIQIYSGELSSAASIWVQITIVAAGISTYISAKQINYFITRRRVDFSPTLRDMFSKLRGGRPGPYDMAAEISDKFNREVKSHVAKKARERRQMSGKKRARRR